MVSSGTGKGGKSFQDRELAARVRSLALSQIEEVLQGDDKEFKKAVLLKLASSILPRLNEHTGEDGEPLTIQFHNAFAPQKTAGNSTE